MAIKRALFALALFLYPLSVHAQSVLQSGAIQPGHAVKWVAKNIIGDAGGVTNGSAGQGFTDLLVVNAGTGYCQKSGVITGTYAALCSGFDTSGNAFLTLDNYGGGSSSFSIKVNGETIFPGPNVLPANWNIAAATANLGPNLTAPALSFANTTAPSPPSGTQFLITKFGQGIVGQDLLTAFPWLRCNSNSWDLCGTGGDGYSGAPILRFHGDVIGGDYIAFGAADSRGIQVGQLIGVRSSGAIPSPEFVMSAEATQLDGGTGGAAIQIIPDATACCGPGSYTAGRILSVNDGGTGYAVNDTIILAGGTAAGMNAVAKVLGVNSGVITSAYILKGGAYSVSNASQAMTQSSTSGGGSGATFSVEIAAPPFIATQGSIQYIAYNSFSGGRQRHRFYGRNGSASLGVLTDITDQGINDFGHLHVSGANQFDDANITILDVSAGVSRWLSDGPNGSTNGSFAIVSQRSDGSNGFSWLTGSVAGDVVVNTAGLHVQAASSHVAASTTTIDNVAGLGRVTVDGPNGSTNGSFSLVSQRSDGSNSFTVLTTSVAGDVVINTAGLNVQAASSHVAADTLTMDVASHVGRVTIDGQNASTNGAFALLSQRSDGTNSKTIFSTSATDFSLHVNTGALVAEATFQVLPTTAPSSPASGWVMYTDSGDGNKLKIKASTGTVVTLGTP